MLNKIPARLLYFEFVQSLDKNPPTTEEWLQIISLSKIGSIDRPPTQKIIRLNQEDQKALYEMLKTKFEKPQP